jgi:hypothetical protein
MYQIWNVDFDSSYSASYSVETGGCHPGVKAAGPWSWPLIPVYCQGNEWVDLSL